MNKLMIFARKHKPEILLVTGIAGMIFTGVVLVNATIKSTKQVEKYKEEHPEEKITKRKIIKITWKNYILPIASFAGSTVSLGASNRISAGRNAALMTAYTMSNTALNEYKEKTKEIVGAKKEQEIKEAVAQAKTDKIDIPNSIILNEDECWFIESWTGRPFKSTWNKVLKIVNNLNAEAMGSISGRITLSDFCEELGLKRTKGTDSVGWSVTDDGTRGLLEVELVATVKDDKPIGEIYYVNMPKYFG